MIQQDDKSTRPVGVKEPHFSTDPEFKGAPYVRRAELLCRRLVQKRLYAATVLAVSDGTGPDAVTEPAKDLTFRKFVAGLAGRVAESLA